MSKCPCCGSDVANADRPLVSLDSNKIMAGGEVIQLGPSEAEFIFILAKAMPRPLRHDFIIQEMWGANPITAPLKAIQVHVCKLRKKLKPAGLQIRTIHGTGYVLEYAPKDLAGFSKSAVMGVAA